MPAAVDPHDRLRAFLRSGAPPDVADDQDGLSLEEAAAVQGLSGLLATALAAAVPGPSRRLVLRLAERQRALAARGLRQLALAGRVLSLLEAASLRALPLKGAALAERFYDCPSHRPMADVDILALDDWPQARRLLLEQGFVLVDTADHAIALRCPESSLVVELHHAFTSCAGLFPVDADGLFARSLTTNGLVPRVPSAEDLMVHLALHASFQHALRLSLVQYLDFRRVAERTVLDVGRLQEAARAVHAERALAMALQAAAAIVDAPVASFTQGGMARLARRSREAWRPGNTGGAELLRIRWSLARGRRAVLLARTLAGARGPDPAPASWRHALPRMRGLVRVWGPHFHRRAPRSVCAAGPVPAPAPPFAAEPAWAAGVARTYLDAVGRVRLAVTGVCMAPLLDERQPVEIASTALQRPRFGDVVLFEHPQGLRLHRIVWAPLFSRGRWRTAGDAARFLDAPLQRRDVLGVVVAVDGRRPSRLQGGGAALRSLARALLRKLARRA
jgi:hypothetical protein